MDINDCLKALDDGTQIVTTTFGWLEKWQEQSHSQGFNTAIDKAVEIYQTHFSHRDDCPQLKDYIENCTCGYRDYIDELEELKEE